MTVKMAVRMIKLLRNKREVVVRQVRRDIALLLQSGQDATTQIRVEHVIREQNVLAANEFIELFCELVLARLSFIVKQRECPANLKEGIASLVFAAPRCSEIPELEALKNIFEKEYLPQMLVLGPPTCFPILESKHSHKFYFLNPETTTLPLHQFIVTHQRNPSSILAIVCGSNYSIVGKVICPLPSLSLIVTTSVGMDHIDLTECCCRGILVTDADHPFSLPTLNIAMYSRDPNSLFSGGGVSYLLGSRNGRFSYGYSSFKGSRTAEYMKKNLFKNISSHPDFIKDTKTSLVEAFKQTNVDYLKEEKGYHRDAGSAASTAMLLGDQILVANVGDPRVVVSRAGSTTVGNAFFL